MKSKKCFTVTVGIPAHNEEQNIAHLINSILKQKSANYHLERIFVICDGSTDRTAEIAIRASQQNSIITVLDDGKRKGKTQRLNEVYALNKSDILITIDADIIPADAYAFEKIINPFYTDERIVVSAGNCQPFVATSFQEKIINAWHAFWYEVRKNLNNQDNIHNSHAAFEAITRPFLSTIRYPKNIIATAQYLYFSVKTQNKRFYFAEDARTYFYSPTSIQEYFLQVNRYGEEKKKNAKVFGSWIYKEYAISSSQKLRGFIAFILNHPVSVPFAIAFYVVLKLHKSKTTSIQKGSIWKTVSSTKRSFQHLKASKLKINV